MILTVDTSILQLRIIAVGKKLRGGMPLLQFIVPLLLI